MNRRFSFQQYRTIDLILFAVMMVFSEAVIVTAARFWFPDQLYTVSVVAALTAIVMMRWGPWAAIHAVLGGAVFCFVSGATAGQFIIYCIGNLGALAGLLLIRLWGKEAIRQDVIRSLAFAVATQLCMQLSRGLVALALGHELSRCVGFITTDVLSGLFTAVIIWIARRLDGIFEDQKHYLLRINGEEEKGGIR
ncbi:MAG: hypothetical protein II904_02980 [Oscillospiraceae bacterium]|nr:hypothetical protein [Oscillospiraceae bacterium]